MLPWEKQTFVYTKWKIRLSVALLHGSLGIINEQLGKFPVKVNAIITYFHQQTFGIWNTEEANVHINSCEEKKKLQTESLHLKKHEQLSGKEITPLPGKKKCLTDVHLLGFNSVHTSFEWFLPFCSKIWLNKLTYLFCGNFFFKLQEGKKGSRGRIYLRSQSPVAAGGR